MAKKFAPRIAKKDRKVIETPAKYKLDLLERRDGLLLEGARIEEVRLKTIKVKEQVRTKFNDDSLRDLGENIRTNGLIQPLVVHYSKGDYVLICGERRFRAMTLIQMDKAPCFILENKTEDELMAIQFSENSSREALHFIDKADGILNYQKATRASERKIQAALGISKSEVHRSLLIAKMPKRVKEAAKKFDIEKYVLLELDALEKGDLKSKLQKKLVAGEIQKRSQVKKMINSGVVKTSKRPPKVPVLPKGLSANAFLKAMNSKSKNLKLDKKTRDLLKTLVEETKEMVDM